MNPNIYPLKSEFLKLSKHYNLIPISLDLPCDLDTPISLFYKVFKNDYGFLLESVEGAEKWARYSFIGIDPFLIFRSKGKKVNIIEKEKNEFSNRIFESENAFLELKKLVNQFKSPVFKNLPRFSGGAVGFVSYESVRFFENIPCGEDSLSFSDLHFMFPKILLVHDRLAHTLKLIYNLWIKESFENPENLYDLAVETLISLKNKILKDKVPEETVPINYSINFIPEIQKEEFLSMVKKAKEYIENGDVIQVVLSQRFFLEEELPSFLIYRALRKVNPSPYLFYLKLEDEILIGSSPEILVRMEEDVLKQDLLQELEEEAKQKRKIKN